MRKIIAGVMGPGEGASDEEALLAYDLGGLIAKKGWILLTGGRKAGVMHEAGRGAKVEKGTVVGILPGTDTAGMSDSVDVPVITGMHDARNSINVLSSDILFFIGLNPGTASELSLALKYFKPSVLVAQTEDTVRTFQAITGMKLNNCKTALGAVQIAERLLSSYNNRNPGV